MAWYLKKYRDELYGGQYRWTADEPLSYSMSGFSTFKIRLLTLLPGAPDSLVCCTLEKVSLLHPGSYIALSYCWGDPHVTKQIMIDGILGNVTVNLEAALRQMRALGVRRLWVDAVCINQADVEERERQVARMKQIYANAEQVIAWLGAVTDENAGSIDTLQSVAATWEASSGHLDSGAIDRLLRLRPEHILGMQYWSRMWIVQEIVVNDNVVVLCGTYSISWNVLVEMLQLHEHLVQRLGGRRPLTSFEDSYIGRILSLRNDYLSGERGTHSKISLAQGMIRTRKSLSTDPRDKVYALLGICHDVLYTPDYTQPVEELLVKVLSDIVSLDRTLDFLFLRPSVDVRHDIAPSWAPTWLGLRLEPSSVPEAVVELSESFDEMFILVSSRLLKVRVRVIGTISYVFGTDDTNNDSLTGTSSPEHLGTKDFGTSYYRQESGVKRAILQQFGVSKADSSACLDFLGSLWTEAGTVVPSRKEEITKGLQKSRGVGPKHPDTYVFQWLDSLGLFPINHIRLHEWFSTSKLKKKSAIRRVLKPFHHSSSSLATLECNLVQTIVSNCDGKNWIGTSNGMIGLADKGVMNGDVVCLIDGCTPLSPVAVRGVRQVDPQRGEMVRYRLVGQITLQFSDDDPILKYDGSKVNRFDPVGEWKSGRRIFEML